MRLRSFRSLRGACLRSCSSMFGIHPLLEKVWLSGDPVTLQLKISPQAPIPLPYRTDVSVKAKVISARQGHTGRIALWENQISLDDGPLAEARFNLVGFPDFEVHQNFHDYAYVDSLLQPVKNQLPEGWTVSLRPPSKELFLGPMTAGISIFADNRTHSEKV